METKDRLEEIFAIDCEIEELEIDFKNEKNIEKRKPLIAKIAEKRNESNTFKSIIGLRFNSDRLNEYLESVCRYNQSKTNENKSHAIDLLVNAIKFVEK